MNGKKTAVIIVGIVVVMIMSLVTALGTLFNKSKQSGTEMTFKPGDIVFDWYRGQTGMAEAPRYRDISLTKTDDPGKLQLDVYYHPYGDDEETTRTTYIVDAKVFDDVMKIVKKYKMSNRWNELRPSAEAGAMYACRFYLNGEKVRVTSENMPKKGKKAFSEIESALCKYISDDRLAGDNDTIY